MSHAKWKQGFASCMDQKYSLDSFHPKTKIDKLQIYLRQWVEVWKMDGIQVTDTVFSRVLMLRTATLTCNRNLHEYLAFWSWFSYFWTTKALPTKPLVICHLFHCKCRLPGAVFKCEITLFKNTYFYIIQSSLDRWESQAFGWVGTYFMYDWF